MKLSLIIEKATTYTDFEFGKPMNPYFVASISKDKTYKSTTKVGQGLNPVFNEGCTFVYEGEEILKIEFFHESITLGGINIKVNTLIPSQVLKSDYDIYIGTSVNWKITAILRMESEYYQNNINFSTGTGIGLGLNNLNFQVNTFTPNRNYYQPPSNEIYSQSYSCTTTSGPGVVTNTNYNHITVNPSPYNHIPKNNINVYNSKPQYQQDSSTISINNPGQNINISTGYHK